MCDIIIIAYAFSRREIFNNLVKEYLANLIQWNGNLILGLLRDVLQKQFYTFMLNFIQLIMETNIYIRIHFI